MDLDWDSFISLGKIDYQQCKIMGFKDIKLKKSYYSDYDDILHDFYIPVLTEAVEYNRLAGFFSSSSLAICARGILGLIKNGGKMRLITSPRINEKDYQVILQSKINPTEFIEKKMIEDIESISDDFIRDHIFALGWMLANNKLDIKIAIVKEKDVAIIKSEDIEKSGIFHIKVGILTDKDDNIVTFSGSVNESAYGWTENVEEIKVCRSWDDSQKEWLEHDISKFENFWNNKSPRVETIDLPEAVKRKLIEISPSDLSKIDLKKWELKKKPAITLFSYQKEAISNWIANDMKGIFEMATGTGKTFTALGCLNHVLKTKSHLFCVIACPYKHLIRQWDNEVNKFGLEYEDLIIADSSNRAWKKELTDSLIDQKLGRNNRIIVITTHRTFSSKTFMEIINTELDDSIPGFLIVDEVHGIGSPQQRQGLSNRFNLRLGLSATPRRFFDDIGTITLFNYFGDTVYQFTLEDALTKINPATKDFFLTQYRYYPIFVKLKGHDLEEYIEQSKKIALAYSSSRDQEEKELILTQLLNARANIIKNSEEKYSKLIQILKSFSLSQKWIIIYCTPQQIERVMRILLQFPFIIHRFTMDEDTIPNKKYGNISEREYILKNFAEGEYQILVAMKILDEGVDVPPARIAILMASSGNPREYIQRIGRVIRKYPGKDEASIYDIIVVPSKRDLPKELKELEQAIFDKELKRCEYIAKLAINNSHALKELYAQK